MIRTSTVRDGRLYPERMDFVIEEVYEQWSERIQLIPGDIVFSREAPIGESAVIPKDDSKYFLGQRMVGIRPTKDLDADFLVATFLAPKFRKEIFIRNAESTTVANFGIPSIKNYEIYTPNVKEQLRIGIFFKKLDDAIALHQRKLDLLKQLKQAYLQKMFPKNGVKVPELRFADFEEEWELRKLGEIADRYDNLRVPITESKRVSGETPYYGANGIQDYVEGYTHNGEFILVAEDGANDLKNYPVNFVNGKIWVNNHAHVLQSKVDEADNMFLVNAINNINIEPFLVGGGRAKLNADVMMKLEVNIPSKKEQKKIGMFFKQVDNMITLHQKKINALKSIKKTFLNKMFI